MTDTIIIELNKHTFAPKTQYYLYINGEILTEKKDKPELVAVIKHNFWGNVIVLPKTEFNRDIQGDTVTLTRMTELEQKTNDYSLLGKTQIGKPDNEGNGNIIQYNNPVFKGAIWWDKNKDILHTVYLDNKEYHYCNANEVESLPIMQEYLQYIAPYTYTGYTTSYIYQWGFERWLLDKIIGNEMLQSA